MSQIAQQDHLYIEVVDLGDMTDAEKAQIVSAWKRNVLDDVIFIVASDGNKHTKVAAWYADNLSNPTELSIIVVDGAGPASEYTIAL